MCVGDMNCWNLIACHAVRHTLQLTLSLVSLIESSFVDSIEGIASLCAEQIVKEVKERPLRHSHVFFLL